MVSSLFIFPQNVNVVLGTFLRDSLVGQRLRIRLQRRSNRRAASIPRLERSPGGGHGNPLHGQRSLAGYSSWDHKRTGHDSATKQQQPKREAENVSLTDVAPHGN